MANPYERTIERYAELRSRKFPKEQQRLAYSMIEQILYDVRGITLAEEGLSQRDVFRRLSKDVVYYIEYAARCKEPMAALQLLRNNPQLMGMPAFSEIVHRLKKTPWKIRPNSTEALQKLFDKAYKDGKTNTLIEHRRLQVEGAANVKEALISLIGYGNRARGTILPRESSIRYSLPYDSNRFNHRY